jgi:hypothetical protein
MKPLILLMLVLALPTVAKEEQRQCNMGRDYWLYTPENIDKTKTYWLIAGIHAYKGQGSGAGGLAGWVKKYDNVIVVGPSFPSTGPYYQSLQGNTDTQLLDIQKDLSKEFKLYDKMFVYGFSGGSQYAHRFASKHSKNVIGISVHSGGSWDTSPSTSSDTVLWTLSCGLKDTARSGSSKLTRIEHFRNFYEGMNKGDFTAKPFATQAGHSRTPEVKANTEECFRVSTSGLFDYQRAAVAGMTPKQRETWIRANSKLTDKEFDDGAKTHTLKVNQDGWTVGPAGLKSMADTRMMLDGPKKNAIEEAARAKAQAERREQLAAQGYREWTDKKGKKVVAKYFATVNGVVGLVSDRGVKLRIPLASFSTADQEYIATTHPDK